MCPANLKYDKNGAVTPDANAIHGNFWNLFFFFFASNNFWNFDGDSTFLVHLVDRIEQTARAADRNEGSSLKERARPPAGHKRQKPSGTAAGAWHRCVTLLWCPYPWLSPSFDPSSIHPFPTAPACAFACHQRTIEPARNVCRSIIKQPTPTRILSPNKLET